MTYRSPNSDRYFSFFRQIVQLVQQITLNLDNPASVIHDLVFHMVGFYNRHPEKPTKNADNFRNEFEKNYRFYQAKNLIPYCGIWDILIESKLLIKS